MTIELTVVLVIGILSVAAVALEYVKRKYPGDGS